jgi:hypothetical protein
LFWNKKDEGMVLIRVFFGRKKDEGINVAGRIVVEN